MDRVAFENAAVGLGMLEKIGPVPDLDRFQRRDARADQLAAAGEAGHQVRLDQAGGDLQIGLARSACRSRSARRAGSCPDRCARRAPCRDGFRCGSCRRSRAPTISTSSSPSLGRCRPVATRIVILSRGMPAASSVASIGGRISWLGTGRVMSQMTMQASLRPRANSAKRRRAVGLRQHFGQARRRDRPAAARPCRPACARRARRAARRPARSGRIRAVRACAKRLALQARERLLLLGRPSWLRASWRRPSWRRRRRQRPERRRRPRRLPLPSSSFFFFIASLKTRTLGRPNGLSPSFQRSASLQLGQPFGARQHAAAANQSAANPQALVHRHRWIILFANNWIALGRAVRPHWRGNRVRGEHVVQEVLYQPTWAIGQAAETAQYMPKIGGQQPHAGGKTPSSISAARTAKYKGSLMANTEIVARPTGVNPSSPAPLQAKCSAQWSCLG